MSNHWPNYSEIRSRMQKELSPFLDALASSCCGRRRLKNSFPEAAEMACIRKTAALGNRFKREPRIAEQRSGKLESQPLLILQWSKTGRRFEGAHQITRTHVGKLRQPRQPQLARHSGFWQSVWRVRTRCAQ
jgi:hypothetical protein